MKINKFKLHVSIFHIILLIVIHASVQAQEQKETMKSKLGLIIPYPILITDPAFGIGGGLAPILIHQREESVSNTRLHDEPSITGIAGYGTSNKTWGAGIFHTDSWKGDRIRYMGGLLKTVIHVDYYGASNTDFDYLKNNPVKLKMDAWGLNQKVTFRIKETDLFIGGQYMYMSTDNTLDTIPDKPLLNEILNKLEGKSTLSIVGLIIDWDSRDNIFTPTTGIDAGIDLNYSAEFLGSSSEFFRISPYIMGYKPIGKTTYSAFRFVSEIATDGAPFYALPFVSMRGVPSLKYQGNIMTLAETEWRQFVYKNWALVGFLGGGKAFNSFSEFGNAQWVYSYGTGFRFRFTKYFNINTGMDFAWSNENFAFYFIIGSAWF